MITLELGIGLSLFPFLKEQILTGKVWRVEEEDARETRDKALSMNLKKRVGRY